jgi:tetratricopeptide (TPR) repeat protein
MKTSALPANNTHIFTRTSFLHLLTAALESGSYRFARQAALNWLAVFPGDLTIQLALGKSHLSEGKLAQALPVVERVCRFDPQYLDAQETLASIYQKIESDQLVYARAASSLLGSTTVALEDMPEWFGWHQKAREAISAGDWQAASHLLHQVQSVAPDFALAAIDHLDASWQFHDRSTVYQLSNLYHTHWPDCLQFGLRLAEIEIEFGNETIAVGLLHQCVANDAIGQTAMRLWGRDHRYQPLWPGGLEIFFDLPVPVDVAFQLGWNRLPAGELVAPPPQEKPAQAETLTAAPSAAIVEQADSPVMIHPEDKKTEPVQNRPSVPASDASLKAVEDTFARLAKQMKKPSVGRSDGRYPVYVIFSTLKGLDVQYGPQTRDILIKEMQLLADYVAKRPGWNSLVFLPDQKECADRLGITLVDSLDPWKLKLSLADLDQALAKKGQMIGAVLIVGGSDIVPFHHLPNPTDDVDKDVPSDNPYGTLDSNYFAPEWPVGRLPGESGKDAGLLLELIRGLNQYHAKKAKSLPQLGNLFEFLLAFLHQLTASRQLKGYGYTASVWKESSALVLQAMGDSGDLLVSPPQTSQTLVIDRLQKSALEYFNLHGLPDAAEWYGQKDASDPGGEPDYPVALSPKNLVKNGAAPQIVYSEACYGAHILDKCEDQSMALKFLAIGCHAVVGSTTIAYGSVNAPLIGADLLGYHFWKFLRDGLTVGEALLQARLTLVKEMNQRQGFLDGEDQKTLISFVLYGDPLTGYDAFHTRSKSILRFKTQPAIKTITDVKPDPAEPVMISQAVMKEVKAIVEAYLPGLDNPEIHVSERHDLDSVSGAQARAGKATRRGGMVVTVSKSVRVAKRTFQQYARITLNEKGKMIKLTISR